MKLKVARLVLQTDRPLAEGAAKLRGFFGRKFPEHPILHHHVSEGYLYVYPKVQYKVIGGTALVLGVEEGADILKQVMGGIDELVLGRERYEVIKKIYAEETSVISPTRDLRRYRFLTPWLALNSRNYEKYRGANWREKKSIINSVLVGNILSMCKGLGFVVEKKLEAHTKIEEQAVEYKGVRMIGLTGEFEVNFLIPDFFGLGKGVSQGYGAVKSFVKEFIKGGDKNRSSRSSDLSQNLAMF
ncbi:MAG: hypothetical protein APU95_02990 [Hadesarchaea archaeon YNP_N21]|nr:MAG: hypothetical protein APU95_02990 [Hadesarchaea archaeon YNP_N21]